jgi:hypothetical protein
LRPCNKNGEDGGLAAVLKEHIVREIRVYDGPQAPVGNAAEATATKIGCDVTP